ncbi:prepilin peptidase [Brevibacterium sp. FME37]|uniref:prepilin peptidase n=1 Tax=Brevibacterium sp. FME37 TaxID=2742607 RepID=UPI00186693DB|nr:prepilin peptidase [Brevibacterium sp. FME37]
MDSGVLHGWPIVATAVFSAVLGVLLACARSWWLADDKHFAVLSRTRLFRPLPLTIFGTVLAVAAALFFPGTDTTLDSGLTRPGADFGTFDRLLLALSLGAAAAATPFLVIVDIVVHRLPDRIVYPLIGTELLVLVLGQLLGESPIWALGLIAGAAGVLFFGSLYLIGRVLHARTMGLGDVKLVFIVFCVPTLFSAWAPALVFIIMMLIAGIVALITAAAKRSLRATTIAFGPAMLSGMWFGAVLAPNIL